VSFARVFLLRAGGVALVLASLALYVLREKWGSGALPSLGWAALWAWVLGAIGYRSLAAAMACEPVKMLGVMAKGVIVRLLALAASQGAVFLAFGGEWGRRTLFATVLLYLAVLGVEVITLNQALRAGTWQRRARETGGTSEGSSGE
jgi:hypothetical protein